MFRKIHSNREPGASVYRELQREFNWCFVRVNELLRKIVSENAKGVFIVMVLTMLVSVILSFIYFRNPDLEKEIPANRPAIQRPADAMSLGNQFDQLLSTTSHLREIMLLRRQVESILTKQILTAADSAALVKALDRLRLIQQPQNSENANRP